MMDTELKGLMTKRDVVKASLTRFEGFFSESAQSIGKYVAVLQKRLLKMVKLLDVSGL